MVSGTDGCLESPVRWCREGKEKLRPGSVQRAAGDSSCCHSALTRDVFAFETVPFVRLSPKSQLSCSPSHTVSALAGTCEALRLAYGADRRKNIRPARSKQCVPSWQAPFLAKEEEEMWP